MLDDALFGTAKNVNAIHLLATSQLLLSVDNDNATLAGLTFKKGDLVEYDAITHTASLYFDGATRFGATKNINGIYLRDNGNIVLTLANDSAILAGLTFSNGDVVEYDPLNDYATRLFSESLFETAANIDALYVATVVTVIDTDGDGIADGADAFPLDPAESTDGDGDGVGDNADAYPNDSSATAAVVWHLDVPASGQYDVYVKWTSSSNRTTQASYAVHDGSGSASPATTVVK